MIDREVTLFTSFRDLKFEIFEKTVQMTRDIIF